MTALGGYWSFGGAADPARECERMLAAQQVYGREPAAVARDGRIALGRRLYRLLPEDRFDRGSITDAGGSQILAADVRLDNRAELCGDLGIGAGTAETLSDSAILLRALVKWDAGAVDRLLGDFAFAWWDGARQRLLLARDAAGQRPLHYHAGDGFFAFASMPKGLHALAEVPRAPDRQAMLDFLALIPETGPESYFTGVHRLLPAHLAIVTRGGIETRRYWNPPRHALRLPRAEDYEEALREQLDRAVACRLRGAGQEVAAHMSGGLDSCAVATTAARQMAAGGGRVIAYTAVPREGFRGTGLGGNIADEGPMAAQVAALHPNIEHVLMRSAGKTPFDDLERYFHLNERPMLNLCNGVWWNAILDDAKARRLSVLLTGQNGNMSISYDGMHYLPQLLREGRLLRLSSLLLGLVRSKTRVGTLAAATLGPYLPGSLWKRVRKLRGRGTGLTGYTAVHPDQADALARRAAQRALDPAYRPRKDGHDARMWVFGRVDQGNYNKGTLGGWGIDMRDPTADRRLFEFCLSVPLEHYLTGGVPRSLARRAFADRLPPSVLGERRKGYQAADWYLGLKEGQAQAQEETERFAGIPEAEEVLDLPLLRRLGEGAGGITSNSVEDVERYRLSLLRGVSAGHFIRKATGSNR